MTRASSRTSRRTRDAPQDARAVEDVEEESSRTSTRAPSRTRDAAPTTTAVATRLTAADYIDRSRAPRTRARYRAAWAVWTRWADSRGIPRLPVPPDQLCAYLVDRAHAGIRPSTLSIELAALGLAHETVGVTSPAKHPQVRRTLDGLRREYGVAPVQRSPLLLEQLRRVVDACAGADLPALRDTAMCTLGWAGAFRSDELVALNVEDLEPAHGGLVVTLRRSKTDQYGAGRQVRVPFAQTHPELCPVVAVEAWVQAAQLTRGALFRRIFNHSTVGERLHPVSVQRILERRLAEAGLDAAGLWGSHSLRSGHVTEAVRAGAPVDVVRDTTGHKSVAILFSYVRAAEGFSRNSATMAGL